MHLLTLMTGRSIDIALTKVEAGEKTETVYENVCTLSTEPDLSFNYASTDDLEKWGFAEGCFTCFLRDKIDTVIQVVTTYQDKKGAKNAYEADARYLIRHGYGKPVSIKTIGETSLMLKKKDTDGITFNLLFLKDNVFSAVSAKYKKERVDNIDYLTGLAEKIIRKIK